MINTNTMNKKIQELARRAGAEFYAGFAGSPNSVKFMEKDLEKFADLIVEECALSVSHIQTARIPNGEYVIPSQMIRKHFGVQTDSVSEDTEDPIAKIDRLFRGQ